MGFRFQKRITLFPGVRLNLSKSGASVSVGPRGASVNIGKRGVFGTVGLPGSGLSYRERLDKPRRSTPASSSSTGARERAQEVDVPQLPSEFSVSMDGDFIVYLDENRNPLSPNLTSAARRVAKEQTQQMLELTANARNAFHDALINLHLDIPTKVGTVAPSGAGSSKPFRESFADQSSYMEALMTWRAQQANAGPQIADIENAILAALGPLEWPQETNIAVELRGNRLMLDVDLPEIEDLPTTRWTPHLTSASVQQKALSQKDLAALYLGHISSLLLRLIGHSFAICSDIQSVALSAYTQRSASTGRIDDEYVAVVEMDRNGWNLIDLSQLATIDPENLLRRFGAKMETNARGILKIQTPLQ